MYSGSCEARRLEAEFNEKRKYDFPESLTWLVPSLRQRQLRARRAVVVISQLPDTETPYESSFARCTKDGFLLKFRNVSKIF